MLLQTSRILFMIHPPTPTTQDTRAFLHLIAKLMRPFMTQEITPKQRWWKASQQLL